MCKYLCSQLSNILGKKPRFLINIYAGLAFRLRFTESKVEKKKTYKTHDHCTRNKFVLLVFSKKHFPKLVSSFSYSNESENVFLLSFF